MKRILLERRTKMLNLLCKGVPLRTIVIDFSRDYDVSEKAIYMDWRNRQRWAPQIAQLNDPSLIDELVQGLKQILPNAWYEYKTNANPAAKVGALRLAKETYLDLVKVLQSIGRVEKAPEQLRIEQSIIVKMWKPSDESTE